MILWTRMEAFFGGANFCLRRQRTPCWSVSPMTIPWHTWENCPPRRCSTRKCWATSWMADAAIRRSLRPWASGVLQVFHSGRCGRQVGSTVLGGPIQVGEVTVLTGDYVLADRDGIVIIPCAIASEVVQETEEVLRKENLVRKAILQGVDPVQAYLQYGKF